MQPIIDQIVKATNGRFCTITFEKHDLSERTINGRIGVHCGGQPAAHRMDSREEPFLLLWSVRDRGYRRISGRRIKRVAAEGTVLYNRD
jgi:hypothetical protein